MCLEKVFFLIPFQDYKTAKLGVAPLKHNELSSQDNLTSSPHPTDSFPKDLCSLLHLNFVVSTADIKVKFNLWAKFHSVRTSYKKLIQLYTECRNSYIPWMPNKFSLVLQYIEQCRITKNPFSNSVVLNMCN